MHVDGKYITRSPWLAMGQEYNRKVFHVHKSSILLYDDALVRAGRAYGINSRLTKFQLAMLK
jgi:hypothetical protein